MLGNAKLVSDLFIQQTGNDQPHDCHVRKGPLPVIQRAMHIHPTVAEYLPSVLSKLEPFADFDELTRAGQKEIMTATQC